MFGEFLNNEKQRIDIELVTIGPAMATLRLLIAFELGGPICLIPLKEKIVIP